MSKKTQVSSLQSNPLFFLGDQATEEVERQQAEIDKEKAELEAQGGRVYDFYFSNDEKKEQKVKQLIILDEDKDLLPHLYVDSWFDPSTRKYHNEICVAGMNQGDCPICNYLKRTGKRTYGKASYNMYLTVLDLTPYKVTKNGKEEIRAYSKKRLEVKKGMHEAFKEMLNEAQAEHGTIKGLRFALKAPKPNTQEAKIGSLAPLKSKGANKIMWAVVSQEKLEKNFNNEAIKDREGKIVKAAGADLLAYDYNKLFPIPKIAELKEKYGDGEEGDFNRTVNNFSGLDDDLNEISGSVNEEPEVQTLDLDDDEEEVVAEEPKEAKKVTPKKGRQKAVNAKSKKKEADDSLDDLATLPDNPSEEDSIGDLDL